jgi:hypothetical protein
MTYYW